MILSQGKIIDYYQDLDSLLVPHCLVLDQWICVSRTPGGPVQCKKCYSIQSEHLKQCQIHCTMRVTWCRSRFPTAYALPVINGSISGVSPALQPHIKPYVCSSCPVSFPLTHTLMPNPIYPSLIIFPFTFPSFHPSFHSPKHYHALESVRLPS